MESCTVGPHHVSSNLLVASWTLVALGTIMLFAEVFVVQGVARADDRFAAIVTLFRPRLN